MEVIQFQIYQFRDTQTGGIHQLEDRSITDTGGFVGINSPIFILYFGSYLAKGPMRRLLVLILLPSAVSQVATYTSLGLISGQILLYSMISLPGLLLGIYIGNRTFIRISEKTFGTILGMVLILLSWVLIL